MRHLRARGACREKPRHPCGRCGAASRWSNHAHRAPSAESNRILDARRAQWRYRRRSRPKDFDTALNCLIVSASRSPGWSYGAIAALTRAMTFAPADARRRHGHGHDVISGRIAFSVHPVSIKSRPLDARTSPRHVMTSGPRRLPQARMTIASGSSLEKEVDEILPRKSSAFFRPGAILRSPSRQDREEFRCLGRKTPRSRADAGVETGLLRMPSALL